MNASVDMLNRWGETFLSFAWPMLWQSSLLMAIVFAFDFLLAKKIRASIRYALWLVVLVKLLLPPALALPTGATWWLWRPGPAVEAPVFKNYTVSVDEAAPPEDFVPQTIPIVPPPKLSGTAWNMLAFAAVGVGLLLWLTFRWMRVARKVRRATTSNTFTEILEEARQLAGLRRQIRLRLIDDTLSPAVYGLFQPVILLPLSLMEKLSAQQLRAVLLHEAIHLRRGDVWVNCAQALLQIFYWWHPLLWLANARIRCVREEAVDDAVMAALRDGADVYAPTLLEVAKFAFRRPLASLGLIGIMESRSALRQRIERLVDFRPPRRAGITFLSLCGIFVFSAVALPMGEGPAPGPASTQDSFSAGTGSDEKTLTMTVDPDVFIRNLKADANWVIEPNTNDYDEILLDIMQNEGVDCLPPHNFVFNTKTGEITTQDTPEQLERIRRVVEQLNRADGKFDLPPAFISFHRKRVLIQGDFFWMTSDDLEKLTADAAWHRKQSENDAHWMADAAQFKQIEKRIKALGLKPFQRPRIETAHGITCEMYVGTSNNWIKLDCDPFVYNDSITLAFRAESASVSMENTMATTNRCEVYGRETVDDNGGIVVSVQNVNSPQTNLVVVLNVKNVEETTSSGRQVIYSKLGRIHLDSVAYQKLPLSEVIRTLHEQSQLHDPDKLGINFLFNPGVGGAPSTAESYKHSSPAAPIDPATGLPVSVNPTTGLPRGIDPNTGLPRGVDPVTGLPPQIDPATGLPKNVPAPSQSADDTQINITLTLNDVNLEDLLNAICLASDHPLQYSIQDYGVVFSEKGTAPRQYEMRTFKVDPDSNVFWDHLREVTTLQTNASASLQHLFSEAGVNFSPPKEVFYNDRLGVLFVYATPPDIDIIERIVGELNSPHFTQDIHLLVQDGKMLYEMGKFDEAKSKLNNALKLDPGNKEAQYYLKLVQETEAGKAPVTRSFKLEKPISEENLKKLLLEAGVKIPPTTMTYSEMYSAGLLLVDGMPAQQALVERVVRKLNGFSQNEKTDPPANLNDVVGDPLTAKLPVYSSTSSYVDPANLVQRTFQVDYQKFITSMRRQFPSEEPLEGFRQLAAEAGVDLSPPKTVFLDFHTLFVNATKEDLNTLLQVVYDLHCSPPQIHVKARFIEVPETFFANAPAGSLSAGLTNGDVLTATEAREFLHQIQSQKGVEELAEPEVTTIEGRQTQMRATETIQVVTNYAYEEKSPYTYPQIGNLETGPILDVIPMVLSDYKINLQTIASLIAFLGYDDAKNATPHYVTNSAGEKIGLPIVLPKFQIQQASLQATLDDGQTLVLFPGLEPMPSSVPGEKSSKQVQQAERKNENRVLVTLVTATLIDAAGNRLHSDDEKLIGRITDYFDGPDIGPDTAGPGRYMTHGVK